MYSYMLLGGGGVNYSIVTSVCSSLFFLMVSGDPMTIVYV